MTEIHHQGFWLSALPEEAAKAMRELYGDGAEEEARQALAQAKGSAREFWQAVIALLSPPRG